MLKICAAALFVRLMALPLNAQQTPIALVHARLIDGRAGAALPDATVIVRGGLIEAVGSSATVAVPPGSRIIDATGKTVMPGLADMHVHLVGGWDGERTDFLGYQRYLRSLLYAGITTVLDTGNVQSFVLQMRQNAANGRLLAPRIYCAGALIDGPDTQWPDISYSLSSASQIPALVKRQKSAGVDVIKIYGGVSVQMIIQLAGEAKKAGLGVLIDHGSRNGSIDLMNAGITAFAHLPIMSPLSDEAVELARTKGVAFISTLSVFEAYAGSRLGNLEFLRDPLIADTNPMAVLDETREIARRPVTEAEKSRRSLFLRRLQASKGNAKKLWDSGLLLVAGTDSPGLGSFQGEGLHHELELLVEAGLTPVQAIAAATHNAAQLMNAAGEWGTIEPGKRADLLVINGQPDMRIQDTHKMEMVMKQGMLLDRERLRFDPARDSAFSSSIPLNSKQ
jgi:imidazolonepropionase-like amidohydrolase